MIRRVGRTAIAIAAGAVFVGVLAGLTVTGWVLSKREQKR